MRACVGGQGVACVDGSVVHARHAVASGVRTAGGDVLRGSDVADAAVHQRRRRHRSDDGGVVPVARVVLRVAVSCERAAR